MVVGDRQVKHIEHFSPAEEVLQRLGSWVVRRASQTTVPDTTSGFRAYNREAALALQVVSKFTYTLETIIQAGKLTVAIDHVPVRTNQKLRESRLFPSMSSYVRRNGVSIFRIYAMYEPLRVFMTAALIARLAGLGVCARFLVAFVQGNGNGHIQSLILGAVLINAAVCWPPSACSATCSPASGSCSSASSSACAASSSSSASSPRTTSRAARPDTRRRPAPGRPAPGRTTEEREALKL